MDENEKTEPREPITPARVLKELAEIAVSMASVSKRLKSVERTQLLQEAGRRKLAETVQRHQGILDRWGALLRREHLLPEPEEPTPPADGAVN